MGFIVSIGGMVALGYTPGGSQISNFGLGFACALLCVVGWAVEVVICAYGMKDPNVNNEHALMIRQMTSAIFYGVVILTVIKGWGFTADIAFSKTTAIILRPPSLAQRLTCATIKPSIQWERQKAWLLILHIPHGPLCWPLCSWDSCLT